MKLNELFKFSKEVNEVATDVAQQMKLTLDKSDLVDTIKNINRKVQKNVDRIDELKREQQVLIKELDRAVDLLKAML